ncbi:MAG: Aspartyl/glutamyl-tRNA(Asn/Gln) amidotransferase subunit B [Ignavibacteria bacterium ADurb.Bin266]|nr:MAG: Aspartyl/glutamyl-tRNA(Asn/Gln) amidotransferase subunit B [Ignavibacteria bacterium ADurb.Bin266]
MRQLSEYYEDVIEKGANPKKASNWIMSELMGQIQDPEDIMNFPVKSDDLATLLKLIDDNTINGKIAKSVFRDMIETGKKPEIIIEEKGLTQVSDTSEIETIIDKVLASNQQSVDDFRNGKEKAMGFLVGQVMKESKGKANPQMVNEILIKKLKS